MPVAVGVPVAADVRIAADRSRVLAGALQARRVAVFGASRTPGKMGYLLAEQLLAHGYAGEVVLVNPAGGTAHGLPLQDASAAAGADVAVVVVPPAGAAGVVEQCGALGIPLAVVMTAGFAEAGEVELQEELRATAQAAGVLLVGPNCLGLFGGAAKLNLTTLPDLPTGGVALVSQSGGLASQVGRRLRQLQDGFGAIVTLGNKLDVDIADCLGVFGDLDEPLSVLLYLESFDEGDALLDAVARLRASAPVTVMLGGRSAAGREAARSHTASMFGTWHRIAALLGEAGAQVCDRLETAVAAACGRATLLRGRRVFVLCDGGGHSVLLSDACDAAGLELPVPSPALASAIAASTPARLAATVGNPFDLAGAADTDPTVYSAVFARVAGSGEYDACLVGGIFGGYADLFGPTVGEAEVATSHELARVAAATDVPAVVQTTYGAEDTRALAALRGHGATAVEWPSEAAAWLAARAPRPPGPGSGDPAPLPDGGSADVDPALGGHLERVRRFGLALGMVDGVGPVTARDDLAALDPAGTWVLRLDDIVHKARVGAVRVGVATADVPAAYDELVALAGTLGVAPAVRVAPFVPHDHELLLTVWRGGADGAGVAIGAGGSGVEAERDVVIGRLPRTPADVDALLHRTRSGRRALAALPAPVADRLRAVVLELVAALDDGGELGDLREIELNPLAAGDVGVALMDALAIGGDRGR